MNKPPILSAPPDALAALFFLPGQYVFKRSGGGTAITKTLLSHQVSEAFRGIEIDTGWINRRLLRYHEKPEGAALLSFEPPGIREIALVDHERQVQVLNVPLPALILFGHQREYYLWASRDESIEPETRLAVAPFPNVSGRLSGQICFGQNELPEARLENLDAIWKLIFASPFNGDNANRKCRSESDDVRRLLFRLAGAAKKRFPAAELIETETTIRQAWKHLTE